MKYSILAVLLLFAAVDGRSQEAFNSLKSQAAEVGAVATESGGLKKGKKLAVEIAGAYLNANRSKFGLAPNSPLPEVAEVLGGDSSADVFYKPQPEYKGIEVRGTDIRVSIDMENKSINYSEGRRHENLDLSVEPAIKAEAARAALIGVEVNMNPDGPRSTYTLKAADIGPAAKLVIVAAPENDDRVVLAWQIDVDARGGPWRTYVDAQKGTVLYKFPQYRS